MPKIARLAAAALALSVAFAGCGLLGVTPETFRATLSRGEEVPPCPAATGRGRAQITVQGLEASYLVEVFDMSSNVVAAHIHAPAPSGANANVVVTLFSGNTPPPVNGTLVQASFGPGDVVGMGFNTLLNEMRNGRAYVNVHTVDCPNGEIRGQLARQ